MTKYTGNSKMTHKKKQSLVAPTNKYTQEN